MIFNKKKKELEKILCEYDELIQRSKSLMELCINDIEKIRNYKEVENIKFYNEIEELEKTIFKCEDIILDLNKNKNELLKIQYKNQYRIECVKSAIYILINLVLYLSLRKNLMLFFLIFNNFGVIIYFILCYRALNLKITTLENDLNISKDVEEI